MIDFDDYLYSQDPQQQKPRWKCTCCGAEWWDDDVTYCPRCLVYFGDEDDFTDED